MYFQLGSSALMLASMKGHTEVVKCLIEANSAVDLQSKVSCESVLIQNLVTIMMTTMFFTYCIFCQHSNVLL